jgi:hypothetical protein
LPFGLAIGSPAVVSNTCGGVVSAVTNALAVALAAGTIPAGGTCSFKVNVVAGSTGVKNNVTTIVSSTEGGIGSPASATLTVTG